MSNKKDLLFTIVLLVLALIISLALKNFVFNIAIVDGDSMNPTLENGEILVNNRISLKFSDLERGDIVIFKSPDIRKQLNVKRVIGLPSESVTLIEGKFYIDDELLIEDYLDEDTYTLNDIGYHWQLGEEEYFLVGDNRGLNESHDSRATGPINKREITGITKIRIFPLNKLGRI
ncbi:MAG: signal peptidase I [Tissierellia bacterium]|nr:signal peptidase I [Tissierellia bacterium]